MNGPIFWFFWCPCICTYLEKFRGNALSKALIWQLRSWLCLCYSHLHDEVGFIMTRLISRKGILTQSKYMNRSTFCEIKYMNGLCFKGQVGFEIHNTCTGSHTCTKMTPESPPPRFSVSFSRCHEFVCGLWVSCTVRIKLTYFERQFLFFCDPNVYSYIILNVSFGSQVKTCIFWKKFKPYTILNIVKGLAI